MRCVIRVQGRIGDFAVRDFLDAEVEETGPDTILTCFVEDTAALTGLVVLLHDNGFRVSEMRAVPD